MSDRHLSVLRRLARECRDRVRAHRAEDHVDGSLGATRGDDLARSSALAEARLASAMARRARSPGGQPPQSGVG